MRNYERWLQSLELTPTIVALRERVRERGAARKAKDAAQAGRPERRSTSARSTRCARRSSSQLLHAPLTELKRGSESPDGAKLVEAVQRLFKLEVAGRQPTRAALREADQDEAGLARADGPRRKA